MELWFVYTLAATLLYGVMYYVQKLGANEGYSSAWIVNISAVTVAVLAIVSSVLYGRFSADIERTLFYAVINGTFFMLGSLIRFRALKLLPSAIVFPLAKINVVFIALSGVVIFGETLNTSQYLAILFFFAVVWLLSSQGRMDRIQNLLLGVVFTVVAGLCTAVSVTTGKFAAETPGLLKINYMAVSYSLVALFTWLLGRTRAPQQNGWKIPKAVRIGVIAGVCNFAGYFMMLLAFSTGNLSVIHPIFSLAIVVPVVLAVVLHGEKMTPRKGGALLLALLAITLMKVDLLAILSGDGGNWSQLLLRLSGAPLM